MNFNTEPKQQTYSENFPGLEEMKEKYRRRLDDIINKGHLTVENIETFADDALKELVDMTSEILSQYGVNEAFEPVDLQLSTRAQEDDAFNKLGFTNIQEILESIVKVKSEIDSLKIYIDHCIEEKREVITPPDQASSSGIKSGSGNGIEDKKFIPRILAVLYILEEDLGVSKESVKLVKGEVTQEMMRQTPYVRIEIPDFQKVAYICEEEGNASYIFDTEKLKTLGISLENLDIEDKGSKNDIIKKHPGIGVRVVQSKNWRERVRNLIAEDIPEVLDDVETDPSEFKKGSKNLASFVDFKREVMNEYQGQKNIIKWYRVARRLHPNWPSSPHQFYKNDGWQGFSELLKGEKINRRREFLSFSDFQTEVRAAYNKQSNVVKWYQEECPKHPKWPFSPYQFYEEEGWIGYRELAGLSPFLSFDDFKREVQAAYSGESSVAAWYKEEHLKHDGWPSAPNAHYEGHGWQGYPSLVGEVNQRSRKTLSFEDFKREVRALYPAGGRDVVKWYREEKNRHPNWHSNPEQFYRDEGWAGYRELAEKYLSFSDFQTEVREVYNGQSNIVIWYKEEQPKHPKWPITPAMVYKRKGWQGFSELVGDKKFKELGIKLEK